MVKKLKNDYDFKCRILEVRRNWRGADAEYLNSAYVTIHDDNLELRKTGLVISSDLGTTNFYYKDITSITFDKPGLFHTTSNININLYSGEKIVLQKVKEITYRKVYEKWITFKDKEKKQNKNHSDNSLLKYAELYKEGLITDDEFTELKRQLIGNTSATSNNFCKNCGSELSENSKFCSECGSKIE